MKRQVVFYIRSAVYTADGISHQMVTIPVSIEDQPHVPVQFLMEEPGGFRHCAESYCQRPAIYR